MNPTVIKVEANLQWQVGPIGTAGRWMAVCEPMDLAVEALSHEELHGMIQETLQLVLTDLLRENELDGFLRDHGWTASNLKNVSSTDDVEFDFPLTLVEQGVSSDLSRVLN